MKGSQYLVRPAPNSLQTPAKEKAIEKENYLTENERILINKFISKIKKELDATKSN